MSRSRSAAIALAIAIPLVASPLAASGAPPSGSDFPGGAYVLDPRHASVIARVKHMGVSIYTVRFDTMDATFDYDPSRPEDTKLTAHVDPASLDVGADYAKEFQKEFLQAASFPKATFTATRLQTAGDGTGTMTGDLTLMGVTKPVTFNVTLIG